MDNINIEKLLELLNQLPPTSETGLDFQIEYAKIMSQLFRTPQSIAVYNSLKELKGIKQKDLEYMRSKLLYSMGTSGV
jgi:hypothetical protein